ncbi:hypothetical protein HY639_00795 [Candidatus Woesearchaeota archaeon]|nr:hypothetical protein [Candidatus Woesearchaeota archaeon]
MIRLTIPFFRDYEEELATSVQKMADLEKLAKKTTERMARVIKALQILEKNGWKWETSYSDIVVFKPHLFSMTKAEVMDELRTLKIDKGIVDVESV